MKRMSCPWMLLTWTLVLCLNGCAPTAKTVNTRIDGATVSLSDSFHDKSKAESRSTKIDIKPPAPVPSPPPATLPTSTPPTSTPPTAVAITQAPTPVSIDVGGRKISAPAGSSVTVELADVGSPAETVHDRNANAAGATLRTDGDKGTFTGSAPEAKLPGGSNIGTAGGGSDGGGGDATGGDTATTWTALVKTISGVAKSLGMGVLLGLAFMVGGIAWVIVCRVIGSKTDWALIGIVEGFGLLLIIISVVAETYPWIYALLLLAAIVAVVWYEFHWKNKEAPAKPAGAILTTVSTQVPMTATNASPANGTATGATP